MAAANLTAARLRELLRYDEETGVLTRLACPSRGSAATTNVRYSGKPAGTLISSGSSAGYVRIRVDGSLYYAHRLAWLYVHGVWPAEDIDHINGDRSDNRIGNLRAVSRAVNMQNLKRAHKDSSHESLGVVHMPQGRTRRWQARIRVNGKSISIGYFLTQEEATAAYIKEKRRLHIGNTI